MSNITPLKNNRGNPNMQAVGKAAKNNTGPRINVPARYKFKRNTYHLPGDLEIGVANVVILRDDIKMLAMDSNTWETIENFYQVSQTEIKKIFESTYNQGKAIFDINLNRAMTNKANKGDSSQMIWMSKNRLGMSDKTQVLDPPIPTNPTEIKNKLQALLKKHGPKLMEASVIGDIENGSGKNGG